MAIALTLLRIFVPLSFLTIGGGQSIIPAIHNQVVLVENLISNNQFLEAFALSRLAPGPKTLMVSLIGWQIAGWMGALVASFAIFTPSALLVYFIARYWHRYKDSVFIAALEKGLIPIGAGTLFAATGTVLDLSPGGVWAWSVAIITAVVLLKTRISPFFMLGFGGLVFLIIKPL